jgi:hypothetical protein
MYILVRHPGAAKPNLLIDKRNPGQSRLVQDKGLVLVGGIVGFLLTDAKLSCQGLAAEPLSQHKPEDHLLAFGEAGGDGIEHPVDLGPSVSARGDLMPGVLEILLGELAFPVPATPAGTTLVLGDPAEPGTQLVRVPESRSPGVAGTCQVRDRGLEGGLGSI